jgi:hypothetical protein
MMAQIHSENIVITLSTLTKDSDVNRPVLANDEIKSALEAVAQELAGAGVIIEVQVA